MVVVVNVLVTVVRVVEVRVVVVLVVRFFVVVDGGNVVGGDDVVGGGKAPIPQTRRPFSALLAIPFPPIFLFQKYEPLPLLKHPIGHAASLLIGKSETAAPSTSDATATSHWAIVSSTHSSNAGKHGKVPASFCTYISAWVLGAWVLGVAAVAAGSSSPALGIGHATSYAVEPTPFTMSSAVGHATSQQQRAQPWSIHSHQCSVQCAVCRRFLYTMCALDRCALFTRTLLDV